MYINAGLLVNFFVCLPSANVSAFLPAGRVSVDAPERCTHQYPHECCSIRNRSWRTRCPRHGSTSRSSPVPKNLRDRDLGELSRSELQRLCKDLNLRAVGKTADLLNRVTAALRTTDDESRRSEKREMEVSSESEESNLSVPTDDVALSAVIEPIAADSGSALDSDASLFDYRRCLNHLSEKQWDQLETLGQLLVEWNEKVNLISRKDIGNINRRHIVPALAMARALIFEDGVEVLDVGTGGGLPGLPLAICFPGAKFTLIDGKGKKIAAVHDMVQRLGLRNVRALHVRAEDLRETFDYILGRAVMRLPKFAALVDKNLRCNVASSNAGRIRSSRSLSRGVLYMRGETSPEELAELGTQPTAIISLRDTMSRGGEGDERAGNDHDLELGYSNILHFTSEDIWDREPSSVSSKKKRR